MKYYCVAVRYHGCSEKQDWTKVAIVSGGRVASQGRKQSCLSIKMRSSSRKRKSVWEQSAASQFEDFKTCMGGETFVVRKELSTCPIGLFMLNSQMRENVEACVLTAFDSFSHTCVWRWLPC